METITLYTVDKIKIVVEKSKVLGYDRDNERKCHIKYVDENGLVIYKELDAGSYIELVRVMELDF